MVSGVKRIIVGLIVVGLFLLSSPASAELQSANYRLEEGAIGTGGSLQSSSANFKADSSTGTLGVGTSASSNFQVAAGAPTTPDPTLTVQVTSTTANFGTFSPSTTSTATATFSVQNYTSYGYVVQLVGSAPSTGSYALNGLTANTASNAGIEQFGVNLVANTSPGSLGANPVNDSNTQYGTQFGFGQASANYSVPNQYRYVSGETIALAPKSSGLTSYTISYIANVQALTPGGQYKSNQSIVVVGTY